MTLTDTRPERPQARSAQRAVDREDEKARNRLGLLRLAVIVLLLGGVSGVFHVGANVLGLTAILVMIMLHEFGHFVTARWADMKVTDFFVGFGPTLWSIKKNETRYGVKAFPVGGFVRVIGMNNLEEVDPADEPRTYRAKSYWQRVRFAFAGTFTHFVIAIVLMAVVLFGFGTEKVSTKLDAVAAGRPAAQAGLRAGDKIVAINGDRIADWDEVKRVITANEGHELSITAERNDQARTFTMTPVFDRTAEEAKAGISKHWIIGIAPSTAVVKDSVPAAIWKAPFEIKTLAVENTKALFGLFTPDSAKHYGEQLTKTGPAEVEDSGNRLLSPVGLFRLIGEIAENGMASVLMTLIAINVFVGIFNMIPLPPFDGGHIAIATYEAVVSRIRGRRHMIDANKILPIAVFMVLALVLLGGSALWLDIRHPLNLR